MNKVLIPVNETTGSKKILSVFYNQIRPPEEVILLHVQKPGGNTSMYDMLGEPEMETLREAMKDTEYQENLDLQSEKVLNFFKKELEEHGLINIRTVIKFGNPVDEILKLSAAEDVDLVIVGCNGKTWLQKLLTGCAAEKIEKDAQMPVLIAKSHECQESKKIGHVQKRFKTAYAS